jgi:hypothetical protein
MRGTVLSALAALGADQLADLHLDQLGASHSTDSRSTSACSSTSTFLTTSSIAILSAPAIAGASLSSNREKSDEHEHRGGRNHFRATAIPSDRLPYQTLRRDRSSP